jgi:LuxR family maltose regulon positive regulatory protein
VHVVIASRTGLPFSVSRLIAEDRFISIGARDLRFTSEEVEALAGQVPGWSFQDPLLFEIAQQCEGWAAGLQIAMLAAKRNKSGVHIRFPEIHDHIIDYFMDEVICHQPQDILDFLLETSVLDRLNPSLCDSVTRRADSDSVLRQLCRENFFLVPLDRQSFWYRYHQMFAEALQERLLKQAPNRVGQLHRRAAEWFYENNMPGEAVYHAASCKDWDFAAWLISRHSAEAILRGDSGVVLRWIRCLPQDVVLKNPFLCIGYAWALFLTHLSKFSSMPFHEIEYFLQQAEKSRKAIAEKHGSQSPAASLLSAHLDALGLHLAYSRNQPRRKVIELGKKTLEKFPEDNLLVKTNTLFTLALTYLDTGELENCSQCLDQARSAAFIGGFGFQVILSDSFRIFLARLRGNFRAAQIMCRDSLESVRQSFVETRRLSEDMLVYYDLHRAYFFYEANRLAEAEAALENGIKAVDILGETYTLLLAYQLMFFIRLYRGAEENRIFHPISEIEKLSVYCSQARALAGALKIRYRVCRFEEDALGLRQAFSTAKQYDLEFSESMDMASSPYPVPFEKNMAIASRLSLARLYLAGARLPGKNMYTLSLSAVAGHIENLMKYARHQDFGELETEAMIILAMVYYAMDDNENALSYMRNALGRGSAQGYQRMFISEGKALIPLLEHMADAGACDEYAAGLIKQIRSEWETETLPGSDLGGGPWEKNLSRQERAVLNLIAGGLSNQQIAEKLCIAVATVKTHNYNIFKKLGVSNRMAASQKARHLGLI